MGGFGYNCIAPFVLAFIVTFKEYNAKHIIQLVVTDSLVGKFLVFKESAKLLHPTLYIVHILLLCVHMCRHLSAYSDTDYNVTLAFRILSIYVFRMKSKNKVTCLRKFQRGGI